MGRILTPGEVAERLRVDRETVYRYIRAGTLPAARLGRSYRVEESSVDTFMARAGVSVRVPRSRGGAPSSRGSDGYLIASSPIPVEAQLTPAQRQRAIELVADWLAHADESEHAETWELLRAALDEDRLSDRRLFSDPGC